MKSYRAPPRARPKTWNPTLCRPLGSPVLFKSESRDACPIAMTKVRNLLVISPQICLQRKSLLNESHCFIFIEANLGCKLDESERSRLSDLDARVEKFQASLKTDQFSKVSRCFLEMISNTCPSKSHYFVQVLPDECHSFSSVIQHAQLEILKQTGKKLSVTFIWLV